MGLAGAAAMAIILPVGIAWACVGLVSITTSSATVQPGDTLTVAGKEFAAKSPVLIRLDSFTGPVLATAPPPTSTMTSQFKIAVTIPADVAAGPHFLVATQDEHDMNGGNPARALFYVGTAAPATGAPAARPGTLIADKGLGLGILALIALAVAGLSLFLVLSVLTRRRPRAEAVP
jgi:hypothetical protein